MSSLGLIRRMLFSTASSLVLSGVQAAFVVWLEANIEVNLENRDIGSCDQNKL